MQLIPVFKIGLLNAWIFILLVLLPLLLVVLFRKGVFKKTDSIHTSILTGRENKIFIFSKVILFLVFIYSIFLPFQLWTIWFYIGLSVFLFGLIILTVATLNFATTPQNKPITGGLYRYSRHPMYLAMFLVYIGTCLATASWLFFLLTQSGLVDYPSII